MTGAELLAALTRCRVVGIVRAPDPDAALAAVLAVVAAGIELVEVSLTSADALGVLRRARAELGPAALLGAGTVRTVDDVAAAVDAGAGFAVTPALTDAVPECARRGLPVLAGALTPTEVHAATVAGATAVKLFPAALGGPGYLRALRDPFPDVPFVPVGGVDVEAARAFLAAGAVAVGVGSPLVGAAARGDLTGLAERAAAFAALAS